MARDPLPPLRDRTVLADGVQVYERSCVAAGPDAPVVVHVHGFGISGSFLFDGHAGMAAVEIDGAHALNFTRPKVVAALIAAHLAGTAFSTGRDAASTTVLFDHR